MHQEACVWAYAAKQADPVNLACRGVLSGLQRIVNDAIRFVILIHAR